jgi:two-component system chemotaxis response regulator CheY
VADQRTLSILVVDDQRSTRMLVRTSLAELGYNNVKECGDGEEALQLLAEAPVKLVISDVNMPKLDGLGLLRAIRGNPNLKSIAFVMLTGRGDGALVKEAIQLGVNGYLVKPFNLASLKQKVAAALGAMANT